MFVTFLFKLALINCIYLTRAFSDDEEIVGITDHAFIISTMTFFTYV